jgi:DNA-binding NarL/FixJ family response regulator
MAEKSSVPASFLRKYPKEYVHRALSVGAEGYLLKQDSSAELFTAIEKIRQGGFYLSPIFSAVDKF